MKTTAAPRNGRLARSVYSTTRSVGGRPHPRGPGAVCAVHGPDVNLIPMDRTRAVVPAVIALGLLVAALFLLDWLTGSLAADGIAVAFHFHLNTVKVCITPGGCQSASLGDLHGAFGSYGVVAQTTFYVTLAFALLTGVGVLIGLQRGEAPELQRYAYFLGVVAIVLGCILMFMLAPDAAGNASGVMQLHRGLGLWAMLGGVGAGLVALTMLASGLELAPSATIVSTPVPRRSAIAPVMQRPDVALEVSAYAHASPDGSDVRRRREPPGDIAMPAPTPPLAPIPSGTLAEASSRTPGLAPRATPDTPAAAAAAMLVATLREAAESG